MKRAAVACALRARLFVVTKEKARGADHPVIMKSAELHAPAKMQRRGSADERKIVPVNYVEIPVEKFGQRLEERASGEVSRKRGEPRCRESMNHHARIQRKRGRRNAAAQQSE